MNTTQFRKRQEHRESGIVAIMVTLILMIVISLIVLGFAQISRRNQRQTLDHQLSTQAFYAAETGVNDVSKAIRAAMARGTAIAPKPDCQSNGGGFYSGLNSVIDEANSVEYTCLTVDPAPTSLVYSNIGSKSTIVPLTAQGGSISSLTFTWQSKESGAAPADNCPANPTSFAAAGSWNCGYGVLRFDLVPTSGSSLSVAGLQSQAMTSFMVPLRPSGTGSAPNPVGYTPVSAGANNRLGVVCNNNECTQTINGLSGGQYYLRVSSIYKDVSLQITARDASNNLVRIQGAQALIDSTGKAADVLRRIQVRLPLIPSSANMSSDYALQSTEAVCKRFAVMENYFSNNADDVVPGVVASTSNPLCRP